MTAITLSPPAQKREDLTAKLEQGVAALRDSEHFKHWLDTASRFHHYSYSNQILIGLQRPDATRVAGYNTWRGMRRQVLKGERGIRILAPTFSSKRCQCAGDCECDTRQAVRFRSVCVFDVAQTSGTALPEVVTLLSGSEGRPLWHRLATIAHDEGLDLVTDAAYRRGSENGWYDGSRIFVRGDVEHNQAVKTLCHELGHHFAKHAAFDCRESREVVAESVAYVTLAHFGLDAGDYSFGYLASWDTDDDKLFKAHLAESQKVAATIIDRLEECQR